MLTNAPDRRPDAAQPASSAPDSTPSARILQAVELLCRRGPMTYKQLGSALDMTKAATWRLVATLRDAHWVCIRHGGSLIQLDPRLDELFATASFADAEFTGVSTVMHDVAARVPVHIDLYAPGRTGEPVLHETSRRLTVSAPLSDMPDDMLFLAIHAAMTPPQLDRYTAQMKTAGESDLLRHLVGASARRRIQQFPGQGWGQGGRHLFVSLRGRMGTAAAMRISPKSGIARRAQAIEAFNALLDALKDSLDTFGGGRPLEDRP